MNEYVFKLASDTGQTFDIGCNDSVFNYVAYRNVLPENVCLSLISEIKKKSGKQLAIIYGNCQTMKLQTFFLNHVEFSDKYMILQIPAVCDYGNKKHLNYFQENFWELCDLLISQRVSNDNRFNPILATQKLPTLIPESAKIIWIPNVYFDGYFPQRTSNLRNVDTDKHQSGRFPAGDKYVDEFLQGGGWF